MGLPSEYVRFARGWWGGSASSSCRPCRESCKLRFIDTAFSDLRINELQVLVSTQIGQLGTQNTLKGQDPANQKQIGWD